MTNNNICFKPVASLLSDGGGGSDGNLRPDWAPEGEEMLLPSEQQGKFVGQISAAVRHGGPPAEFTLSCVEGDSFPSFPVHKNKNLQVLLATNNILGNINRGSTCADGASLHPTVSTVESQTSKKSV